MSFKIVDTTPSAAVASAGTITFSYPDGTDAGSFNGAKGHKLWSAGLQTLFDYIDDFTISFGASDITVTYNGSTSIPAATRVSLQLNEIGADDGDIATALGSAKRTSVISPVFINLGAPDTLDADGVAQAQAVAGAGNLTVNGALASGGVATFDVPRGVQVVSANAGDTTQTATFTGTDEYGNTVAETLTLNGTSAVFGKKAFKTITQVAMSASTSGNVSAGSSDVLGLPIFLPVTGMVVKEMEDGAAATAGTLVAGVVAAATATTGDVRGTYDPNSACDGSKAFDLMAFVDDPSDLGGAQFEG